MRPIEAGCLAILLRSDLLPELVGRTCTVLCRVGDYDRLVVEIGTFNEIDPDRWITYYGERVVCSPEQGLMRIDPDEGQFDEETEREHALER